MRICLYLSFFFLIACTGKVTKQISTEKQELTKPNILWIVCEDISPTLSFYGDSTAKTPQLDALAEESVVYDNVFATVGVCAPSRSSIITGKYSTSIGTMHMRSAKDIASWGKRVYRDNIERKDIDGNSIIEYSAVVPSTVKCFPEYLRADGYFCTNNEKTDYQFAAPLSAWDENDNKAHWRNRPEGKPFFSVFNFNVTHESKLWKNEEKKLTVEPSKVIVPPYLPDTDKMRHTIARNYSNIELLDAQVGELLDELKADGLYDNTIIFFYSDHGGPLPRQKREAYDSGLHVPFMVKHINQSKRGRNSDMISFVDLAPTMLDIAGVDAVIDTDGNSFWAIAQNKKRAYIYGSGDRFDGITDRVRVIRTKDFLYVKNFYPEKTGYKEIAYRKNIPGMDEFLALEENGNLDSVEQQWFSKKTDEELYHVFSDPYNIRNLAIDQSYEKQLVKHRNILETHLKKYGDKGSLPESELIKLMWPDFQQPQTMLPSIQKDKGKFSISCNTEGASISYYITNREIKSLNRNLDWQVYTAPILVKKGEFLHAVAERIGYKTSEMASILGQ